MENENMESVETNMEDMIQIPETTLENDSDIVELETLEDDVESFESAQTNNEDMQPSDPPAEEVVYIVECSCADDTPLWQSDISQYNITNGLLLLILVVLCLNILLRK